MRILLRNRLLFMTLLRTASLLSSSAASFGVSPVVRCTVLL